MRSINITIYLMIYLVIFLTGVGLGIISIDILNKWSQPLIMELGRLLVK